MKPANEGGPRTSLRGVKSNTCVRGEPYALKGARTVRRERSGD